MKSLDTSKLTNLCRQYLSEKFDTSIEIDSIWVDDFEKAIEYFNYYRQHQSEKKYFAYLKNAAELNSVWKQDLPGYKETLDKLLGDCELAERVFSHLRDSTYFKKIWTVRPVEYLEINVLLLIYRTTVLQANKDVLIDQNGRNRVQISSTIEEMVYCLEIEGKKNRLFSALEVWLEDWKEEGIDQRLYLLLKEGGGIIGAR